eukprot:6874098-Alexandrium_andersonii.AAC.1
MRAGNEALNDSLPLVPPSVTHTHTHNGGDDHEHRKSCILGRASMVLSDGLVHSLSKPGAPPVLSWNGTWCATTAYADATPTAITPI